MTTAFRDQHLAPPESSAHSGSCADPARYDLSHYAENGFAVLPDVLDEDGIRELRAEAAAVCRGERGPLPGVPEKRMETRLSDAASGPRTPEERDADTMRDFLCIHQPHKVSSVLRSALSLPAVVSALTGVIGPDVKAMQSMLFIKSEGKPGQAWHQDEYFIPTRDGSLTAAWIALDDATVRNGCLWVLPGSHRRGVIHPARAQQDARFDCSDEAYGFPYQEEDAVPVEVPAGTVVLFNGYLLHRSLPNSAERGFRRALVNHYMSASSLLPWGALPEGEWVARHDYRDIVLVAGSDPYAWKGTEDLTTAHVRPSGEGGCGT
ncbi:phytanoyl-CoA dioxygenase family protein [Streptomyces sp. NPDC001787]|uniref:phytanoyl-CoA dioxygenase family protein n=1 Tax=Streptomyces sp. NPDC001787 TaxID=3154523 RepID=UPI0033312674